MVSPHVYMSSYRFYGSSIIMMNFAIMNLKMVSPSGRIMHDLILNHDGTTRTAPVYDQVVDFAVDDTTRSQLSKLWKDGEDGRQDRDRNITHRGQISPV